jgi:hypothetical protein
MHDQRVIGRATLGGKNFGYRSVIVGIGAQPINRLGWKAN